MGGPDLSDFQGAVAEIYCAAQPRLVLPSVDLDNAVKRHSSTAGVANAPRLMTPPPGLTGQFGSVVERSSLVYALSIGPPMADGPGAHVKMADLCR